jgi:preprotein translocase subunit SecG
MYKIIWILIGVMAVLSLYLSYLSPDRMYVG